MSKQTISDSEEDDETSAAFKKMHKKCPIPIPKRIPVLERPSKPFQNRAEGGIVINNIQTVNAGEHTEKRTFPIDTARLVNNGIKPSSAISTKLFRRLLTVYILIVAVAFSLNLALAPTQQSKHSESSAHRGKSLKVETSPDADVVAEMYYTGVRVVEAMQVSCATLCGNKTSLDDSVRSKQSSQLHDLCKAALEDNQSFLDSISAYSDDYERSFDCIFSHKMTLLSDLRSLPNYTNPRHRSAWIRVMVSLFPPVLGRWLLDDLRYECDNSRMPIAPSSGWTLLFAGTSVESHPLDVREKARSTAIVETAAIQLQERSKLLEKTWTDVKTARDSTRILAESLKQRYRSRHLRPDSEKDPEAAKMLHTALVRGTEVNDKNFNALKSYYDSVLELIDKATMDVRDGNVGVLSMMEHVSKLNSLRLRLGSLEEEEKEKFDIQPCDHECLD